MAINAEGGAINTLPTKQLWRLNLDWKRPPRAIFRALRVVGTRSQGEEFEGVGAVERVIEAIQRWKQSVVVGVSPRPNTPRIWSIEAEKEVLLPCASPQASIPALFDLYVQGKHPPILSLAEKLLPAYIPCVAFLFSFLRNRKQLQWIAQTKDRRQEASKAPSKLK
eukprot:Gb_38485 [translate_table: standard]